MKPDEKLWNPEPGAAILGEVIAIEIADFWGDNPTGMVTLRVVNSGEIVTVPTTEVTFVAELADVFPDVGDRMAIARSEDEFGGRRYVAALFYAMNPRRRDAANDTRVPRASTD